MTVAEFISTIETVHLSEVFLPNRDILIDHRMVALVFHLYQFTLSWEKHTDTETFRCAMGIAEFKTFRPLEGCLDSVGNIAIGIGIPGPTVFGIVITDLLKHIQCTAIHKHLDSEGRFAVGVVLVLRGILILALELHGTHKTRITDGTGLM